MALLGTTTIHNNEGHYSVFLNAGFKPDFDDGNNNRIVFAASTDRARQFNSYEFLDTNYNRRDSTNQSIGHYINIENEWMKIYTVTSYQFPAMFGPTYHRFIIERDIFNTLNYSTYNGYSAGTEVKFYDELPQDVIDFYAEEAIVEDFIQEESQTFRQEEESLNFGVDGYEVEQTLLNPFDPIRGRDVNISTFQNTNQGLLNSNQDGRIELGMYSFNDDNLASNNFPNILSSPFIPITKTNMVNNGDCKFVEKAYHEENDIPIIIQPEGEWRFLSLTDIDYPIWIENYTDEDVQGFTGYGGRYAYVPLSLELDDTAGFNYWGNVITISGNALSSRYVPALPQQSIVAFTNNDNLHNLRNVYRLSFGESSQPVPHIAAWIITNEAYSNSRCLQFMNFSLWNASEVFNYTRNYNPPQEKYPFNWLLKPEHRQEGEITSENYSNTDVIQNNQYRVLNQVQKIYDKFYDNPISPYSSLKIRFKMKTTNVFPPFNTFTDENEKQLFIENPLDESLGYAPKVEIGILQSQFEETPKTGVVGLPDELVGEIRFKAPGNFNSQRYFNGNTFINKRESELGGMSRFQNSIMNEWETFEFDYNLREEHNNRGLIYNVPYGGVFDDLENNGPVEIMLNHNSTTSGLPDPNPAEIYFKVPGYQDDDTAIDGDRFHMVSPSGLRVSVQHGERGTTDYQIVVSALGDTAGSTNQTTGLQDDGIFLEAYLMYIGSMNLPMQGGLAYGGTGDTSQADMVVAYWDGERWSYDNNEGYSTSRYFTPNTECFIIGRLYRGSVDDEDGIVGIDQYINNESQFPTGGVGNLFLFLQSGNNFQGRVLIDDIECIESYEFIPEVDVRKKLSVGKYGSADLTKYYDKELHPIQYKDSQAPLEAQFYFYPQYTTNETFVERLPIYEDFKKGRFYIYDVDWDDGTPKEFTSTPEQIDEDTALYHTYETNGVFEVTGTMIRVKVDDDDNIVGVAHNKKFRLRINVNPGLDEDFKYFGSDGYSFIPFQNTLPIIGGVSEQSNYYKTIKRQLGFLDNEKISIEFKNKSDKLKTELALLKMENQDDYNLEVLPNYMIERIDENDNIIYNGISPIKEELGKGIGDCDITTIKYYNEPKSIWEMFGFDNRNSNVNLVAREGEFLNRRTRELVSVGTLYHIHPNDGPMEGGVHNSNISGGTEGHDYFDNTAALPSSNRYWKNIIPKTYDIFNREGIQNLYIDIESEQNWIGTNEYNNTYYYPVLPKYGPDGFFIDGSISNGKIPFPSNGDITNENEKNESLSINLINDKIEVDVINDNSGNKNYGFFIQDYKPEFDEKTLRVKKNKQRNIFKSSKVNGAF